ncbi:hypothetical protein Ancab_026282 [Ancistrocladus abbreviatus]
MGRPKLPTIFRPYANNPIQQQLVDKPGTSNPGFFTSISLFLRRLVHRKQIDGSSRSAEEEKVYSWLYALAQAEKNLAFEYVRSTERGLSFTEAEKRLRENGLNDPVEYRSPSWWLLLWIAFFHPFNIILIVLSALSYLTSDSLNGCLMLVLVLISVPLRFYQEYTSQKAVLKLSQYLRYPVKVQRCAGRVIMTELIVQVDQRDIVPGDIVHFEPGDLFPGDVRLITSKELVVSQSSLTGESGIVDKTADIVEDQSSPLLELKNICFMGTTVVSGSGTGLVVSTGSKTYVSTMFSTMGRQKPPDDFEIGIRHISYILIAVMLVISTVIGLTDYFTSQSASKSLIFAITVASALTPQMLPLIINTSLAKGALAMAKERCIVKSVTAVRDMGSMDILCIDKTGTLTMNRLIMVSHIDSRGSPKEEVLRFAFLNAYFKTEQKNPLDDAILAYVYTNGYRFQQSRYIKIDEIPFDFARRRVSVILETASTAGDGETQLLDRYVITKGALEEVIRICKFIGDVNGGGTVTALSAEDCQRIQKMGEDLSDDGLRVLGVAMKRLIKMESSGRRMIENNSQESDMVFLGIVTFYDPPKDSAEQALWRLAEKGVKAKVLTGDSLPLAIRVCKEVGIKTTHVITGPELELLSQESFHETVKRATVLARLTPTQKQRVVQSLQTASDHIIGFLGDGINDSLALEAADVGISVDSGASVAKHFASIILLEKDLNVLAAGVEQGRLTFGNTMKYIKMSVVANIGGVLSLLIGILFLGFEPLTPKQLLTQNFLYSLGQIAIPWDRMEEDSMKTPQRWSRKGLPMFILWNAPVCSMCDVATLLFLWFYEANSSSTTKFFRAALFVEGLLMQSLIIHLIRTKKIPFIQDVASWPVISSTLVICAIGIVYPFTPLGRIVGFVALPLTYYGFLVVLFVGYFTVGQAVKMLYIFVYKQWL